MGAVVFTVKQPVSLIWPDSGRDVQGRDNVGFFIHVMLRHVRDPLPHCLATGDQIKHTVAEQNM